jgi:hypothetical protein
MREFIGLRYLSFRIALLEFSDCAARVFGLRCASFRTALRKFFGLRLATSVLRGNDFARTQWVKPGGRA